MSAHDKVCIVAALRADLTLLPPRVSVMLLVDPYCALEGLSEAGGRDLEPR